jgi:hypothetical protein
MAEVFLWSAEGVYEEREVADLVFGWERVGEDSYIIHEFSNADVGYTSEADSEAAVEGEGISAEF